MAGLLSWKKKCLDVLFEGAREGFCRRGRGRSYILCRGAEDKNGMGTNRGKKERYEEPAAGCVKLKTVTKRRRSSSHNTFIAECLSCTEFFVWLGASGEIN